MMPSGRGLALEDYYKYRAVPALCLPSRAPSNSLNLEREAVNLYTARTAFNMNTFGLSGLKGSNYQVYTRKVALLTMRVERLLCFKFPRVTNQRPELV